MFSEPRGKSDREKTIEKLPVYSVRRKGGGGKATHICTRLVDASISITVINRLAHFDVTSPSRAYILFILCLLSLVQSCHVFHKHPTRDQARDRFPRHNDSSYCTRSHAAKPLASPKLRSITAARRTEQSSS
jgi:hypothetical protein